MDTIYDLVIIGGGPAGAAAAVYAARKQLKTLLILKEWGGQSIVSEDVQNWIGTPHLSGAKLADSFKNHVLEYKGDFLEIIDNKLVTKVSGNDGDFTTVAEDGKEYKSKTVLITTGSQRRKLDVPGAKEYENKGITYCASCDGPLFSDQDVVVVGGGNAGFESAAQLLAYTKSVTLLSRSEPKADEITIKKLLLNPKFKLIKLVTPKSIQGETFVTSITYTDTNTNEEITIPASGIFMEIGQIPATSFVNGFLETSEFGNIKTDPRTGTSSVKGVWAAGDCTDTLYHQNNIAAGDAVRALEDIYLHIHA